MNESKLTETMDVKSGLANMNLSWIQANLAIALGNYCHLAMAIPLLWRPWPKPSLLHNIFFTYFHSCLFFAVWRHPLTLRSLQKDLNKLMFPVQQATWSRVAPEISSLQSKCSSHRIMQASSWAQLFKNSINWMGNCGLYLSRGLKFAHFRLL